MNSQNGGKQTPNLRSEEVKQITDRLLWVAADASDPVVVPSLTAALAAAVVATNADPDRVVRWLKSMIRAGERQRAADAQA